LLIREAPRSTAPIQSTRPDGAAQGDGNSHPVGKRVAWALGDIAPGAETSFRVEVMSGAVTYRIGVLSYDVVSGGETP
jgi:hypothetical protein